MKKTILQKNQFKKALVIGAVFSVFCSAVFTSSAGADIADLTLETGCSELPSYTGVLSLKKQRYDVYARLAKRGESALVTGLAQGKGDQFGQCKVVGSVRASGDKWTKIGELSAEENKPYVVELASNVLAKIPDANRPSVMLLPHDSPVCIPTTECRVTIDGQLGYIRPVGTLLNQDSLHVVEVTNPANDRVSSVRYYADDQLQYTTKIPLPFDSRYASYSNQKLARVLVYESGQQVIQEKRTPIDFGDSFGNFIFRVTRKYPILFVTVIVLAGIVSVCGVLLAIAHRLRKRQNWRIHHGLRKERQLNSLQSIFYRLQAQRATRVIRVIAAIVIIFAGLLGLIVLVNNYFLQIITVDGHSMEKTYFTGNQVLVNKVPKTFAGINRSEYVPQRGQVVIVRASFGNAVLSSDDTTNLTLIKRLIGLPGERVVVKDGVLKVYNQSHPKGFQPDKGSEWEKQMTPDDPLENVDIQLGTGEVFVSGDNRPASIDSRFNGALSTKEIIGTVIADF